MAVVPVRIIASWLARAIGGEAVRRTLAEPLENLARDLYGRGLDELDDFQREQVVEEAFQRGRITEHQAEQTIMVGFQQFMSVALSQCGNDPATFRALTDLWNREKEEIQQMTIADLRSALTCP